MDVSQFEEETPHSHETAANNVDGHPSFRPVSVALLPLSRFGKVQVQATDRGRMGY